MEIHCPECGESEDLRGKREAETIAMTCDHCGNTWQRSLAPRCDRCGSHDVQIVPMAIVEKGRGTQLSIVGTRPVVLCSSCDAGKLARFHKNRPNPLMPDVLPTIGHAIDPD